MKQNCGSISQKIIEPVINLDGEVWKPVVGYEGLYDVSNYGRVRNKEWRPGMHHSNIIIKQRRDRGGYMHVTLHKNGEVKRFCVHRLVYEAFVGNLPKYEHKGKGHCHEMWEINHKDENKENNRLDNLELVTRLDNIRYGTRSRRQAMKLTKPVYQYTLDGELIKFWEGGAPEIFKHGYNKSCISECCRGIHPHYKGFRWSYVPL